MDNTSVGYIEMVCYTDIYMYKYAGMIVILIGTEMMLMMSDLLAFNCVDDDYYYEFTTIHR